MADQIDTKEKDTVPSEDQTARARYEALVTEREPYLRRARQAAELTIPALVPPAGATGATILYQPFQSVGADGVNNLAAKLLLSLFPAGSSFFRQTISDKVLEQLKETAGDDFEDARTEIEAALSKREKAVTDRMDEKGARMQLFEGFKHLLVAGNCLIQVLEDGKLKLHKLDRYVVKRDQQGNVLEVLVKETVSKRALPGYVRALLANEQEDAAKRTDEVDIHTRIVRTSRLWRISQEVCGQVVEESRGSYPLDKSPWLPLRFIVVDGEDYGRSYVEEKLGDLGSFEALSQAIVEGSAVMAKILTFVDEGGVTQKETVARSRNGAVVDGRAKDVTFLQVEKFADMRVAKETADGIEKRLQRSFLMLGGVQRDAERVTAEEFRLMAQELDATLGGNYSALSQEMQYPLANRIIFQMEKAGDLPRLPKNVVGLQIVTGLAGLGRNSELTKLDTLFAGAVNAFGPQILEEYVNPGDYFKRRGTAIGVSTDGLIRSDAEVQKSRQDAQQAALAEKAVGPGIKAVSDQMSAQQQAPTAQPQ